MKKFLNGIFLIAVCFQAHGAVTCGNSTSTLPSLDSVYKLGEFRVYYSNNPNNADYIPVQTDVNNNQVPDYVENIAIQAKATTDALSALGFIHPLNSDRYNGAAEFIDIHLLTMNGNGLAFENPGIFINKPIKEGKCALQINVNNNLSGFPGNYWTTVTHEIFHLYQYGYSQFKGGWYLEGMANWAERVFRLGTQGGNSTLPMLLPSTQAELTTNVYDVAYNNLWHRLAMLSDSTSGQLNLPSELLNRTYTDGTKIFKDEKLKGHAFIKKALENAKTKSAQLSNQNGWDPYNWAEVDQVNISNRPYMLKAVQDTMLQFGINQTVEEIKFLDLN